MLPTPTYYDISHSFDEVKIELIYVIEGYVVSYRQYFWLSSIKLSLNTKLFVPFEFISVHYIRDTTIISSVLYSMNELSLAFNAKSINYIKGIYYPNDKKELYRWLVRHGKKLNHRQVLTKESLTGVALFMNHYLQDKLSNKELHKKVTASYDFILKNSDNFPQKLETKALKKAHQRGAILTNEKMLETTKKRIEKALKEGDYVKPNGKINKTALAEFLTLNRRTLDKYL